MPAIYEGTEPARAVDAATTSGNKSLIAACDQREDGKALTQVAGLITRYLCEKSPKPT